MRSAEVGRFVRAQAERMAGVVVGEHRLVFRKPWETILSSDRSARKTRDKKIEVRHDE